MCFEHKDQLGESSMMRKQFAAFAASALALAVSAHAVAGTVTTDGADLMIKTKGGLEVGTTDKQFSFKLGGRVQADYSTFDGFYTKDGDAADAAYFRRAFLELGGVVYGDWAYAVSYDFSHNAGNADDGYFDEASLAYNGFAPVSIKVGRFDPEFGLEKATSSKWVTATERNAAYDMVGWANGSEDGLGVQVSATAMDALYGSAGVYSKDINDEDGAGVKQFNLRGVFAPMATAGNVLHFGANFAQRYLTDVKNFDASVKSRLGMRGVKTLGGNDAGDNGNRLTLGGSKGNWGTDSAYGLEAAAALGAFSVQGEYINRSLESEDVGRDDLEGDGYYVQLAYTLTGEARGYKLGKFDAVKPTNKQLGAWEVFYRYDYLTMADDTVGLVPTDDVDGKVHNVGVNWYVNEAVRLSGVVVKSAVDNAENGNGDDDGSGFVMRAQYVF